MAKSWAVKFYKSKEWAKVRKLALIRDHKQCTRCGSGAYIVHHKIYLTNENIHDPLISLNIDNLECLCKSCHDREHEFGIVKNTRDGLRFTADGDIIEVESYES